MSYLFLQLPVQKANFMTKILSILLLAVILLGFGGCGDTGAHPHGEDNTIEFSAEGYEALFTHGNLHEVEIVITQEEWDGLIQDMKDYAEEDRQGWPRTGNYRKADFVYTGPAGDAVIEEVGFRTKGNVSRIIPQDDEGNFHRTHFKVRFNETFDLEEGTDEYAKRRARRFCGLRTLNLRWRMSGSAQWGVVEDVSQIRELFCYDLMNKAGAYTSRTGSARLTITIDGTAHYFGIYTLIEPVDQSFLTRRYGRKNNDGNLYKCLFGDSGPATLEPMYLKNIGLFSQEPRIIGVKDWETHYRPTYDLKTNEVEADHTVLLDFIRNLNALRGDKLKEYLDANFEVDRFLRYQAMNVLLGKWDDYWTIGNNYHLYFSNEGRIEFITSDYDMALGQGLLPMEVRFKGAARFYTASTGIYDWSNHVNDLMAITSGMPRSFFDNFRIYHSPLVERIFEIEEYRQIYEQHLQDFITPANELFVYSEYKKKYDLMHSLYAPYLDNDTDEGEEMRNDENEPGSVREYFYGRTRSVIEELGLNPEDYELGP